ncbi:DUF1962-domain-containing protein [Xylariaceae sp. FL0804]|nr:DUF1962-domain-containing protein [Xylariaceae sp. FL0804]
MKTTAFLAAAATAAAASAPVSGELQARDTCGSGYQADQRRTNSPCEASNGDRNFCGCDRTDVVQCISGTWSQIQGCPGGATCSGTSQGGATCPEWKARE